MRVRGFIFFICFLLCGCSKNTLINNELFKKWDNLNTSYSPNRKESLVTLLDNSKDMEQSLLKFRDKVLTYDYELYKTTDYALDGCLKSLGELKSYLKESKNPEMKVIVFYLNSISSYMATMEHNINIRLNETNKAYKEYFILLGCFTITMFAFFSIIVSKILKSQESPKNIKLKHYEDIMNMETEDYNA